MSQKAISVAVGLFLAIIIGMFTYAYLAKAPDTVEQNADVQAQTPDTTTPYDYIESVDAKVFYEEGVHTLVGEIPLPTPCDLLTADAIVAESFPEQVTINFAVINNAETCAQVITPARFRVEVTASPEASFSARFLGREVRLNLIPAAPGETPEEFEVFVKG